MRTVLAIGLLTVCALTAGAQEPALHESKDGRFAAKFPLQPGSSVTNQKVKVAGIELALWTSERATSAYSVACCDLTTDALKDSPAAKVLEKSEQGFVAQTKMKVSGSKATTFGPKAYPAREFFADREGAQVRVLLVLAETRLYQVYVIGAKDTVTGKEVDDFFASFVIK
jgi:hypothetical protein